MAYSIAEAAMAGKFAKWFMRDDAPKYGQASCPFFKPAAPLPAICMDPGWAS